MVAAEACTSAIAAIFAFAYGGSWSLAKVSAIIVRVGTRRAPASRMTSHTSSSR